MVRFPSIASSNLIWGARKGREMSVCVWARLISIAGNTGRQLLANGQGIRQADGNVPKPRGVIESDAWKMRIVVAECNCTVAHHVAPEQFGSGVLILERYLLPTQSAWNS